MAILVGMLKWLPLLVLFVAAACSEPTPGVAESVEFAPCPPRGEPAQLPTGDEVLQLLLAVSDHLDTEQTIDGIDCIYAPGALISVLDRTSPLARFWTDLIAEGNLRADPPAFAARLLPPGEGAAERYAVLFKAEGIGPVVYEFELVEGTWLITHIRSGIACDEFPQDFVADIHPNTCV